MFLILGGLLHEMNRRSSDSSWRPGELDEHIMITDSRTGRQCREMGSHPGLDHLHWEDLDDGIDFSRLPTTCRHGKLNCQVSTNTLVFMPSDSVTGESVARGE
jgi:hypothetical protein